MQTKELVKKVWERCEPLCREAGVDLWDVTFEKEGLAYYLTVFIDRDEGVFVEDCEKISRALDPYLDEKQFDSLPSYTLIVSSAGLERRIVRPEHFAWAVGRNVDVSFYRAHDGAMSVCGALKEKTDSGLVLECDGKTVELDMAEVAGVKLHFEI